MTSCSSSRTRRQHRRQAAHTWVPMNGCYGWGSHHTRRSVCGPPSHELSTWASQLTWLSKRVFEVPAKKLARLANMAKGMRITASAETAGWLKLQELASLCGFAQSLRLAISCASLFLRSLYDATFELLSCLSGVSGSGEAYIPRFPMAIPCPRPQPSKGNTAPIQCMCRIIATCKTNGR
jgi:hypothetical protein